MAKKAIILSCEHGGNQIPPAFAYLFEGQEKILESHQGWDPGTLQLGEYLSKNLQAPLVYCQVTRLLIEMNRSLDHPQLFSVFSNDLEASVKDKLISKHYQPYRKQITKYIDQQLENDKACLHFSIHSFTPVLNGQVRKVDIGLLFDPARRLEKATCEQMMDELRNQLPFLNIQFNEPYLGTDDGLTTFLRTKYKDEHYAGIEIEVNQKWIDQPQMESIRNALFKTLGHLTKEESQ